MATQSGGLLRASGALAVGALIVGFAPHASAGVVYSNVTINGSLAGGASFVTGPNDIDFSFPNASVGDGQPSRSGNLIITYIAQSDDRTTFDRMILSTLGALLGSGTVIVNEVIEDLVNPAVIATFGRTYRAEQGNNLPQTHVIPFTRETTAIKVKKTYVLVAPETQALDLANVSLVEQRLVPAPGALMLAGAGGVLALRRRRA